MAFLLMYATGQFKLSYGELSTNEIKLRNSDGCFRQRSGMMSPATTAWICRIFSCETLFEELFDSAKLCDIYLVLLSCTFTLFALSSR